MGFFCFIHERKSLKIIKKNKDLRIFYRYETEEYYIREECAFRRDSALNNAAHIMTGNVLLTFIWVQMRRNTYLYIYAYIDIYTIYEIILFEIKNHMEAL